MTNEVRIRTSVSGNAAKEIKDVQSAWETFQKKGAQGLAIGTGLAAGAAAFGLLDNAIASSVDYLSDAIDAAREEEVSVQKLSTALQANIEGWDGNTDAIEETIKARMELGFADDAQRDSLARLVAATHDVNEALAIQRTAMDLARFKNIGLGEATDALIKVEAGQYRMLKSLGIVLEDGATQTEALAAVQKVAAGQAADYMETSAGGAEELQIKLDELSETVGMVLLPAANALVDFLSDDVVPSLQAVAEWVEENETLMSALGLALDSVVSGPQAAILHKQEEAFRDHAKAVAEDAIAAGELAVAQARAEHEAKGLGDATGDAVGPTRSLTRSVDRLGDEAREGAKLMDRLEDAVDDATDAFLEAALGPKELRLKLKDARDELGENTRESEKLQDKIARFRESGKPVGELKDDLRDLRGEIIDNQKDVISTTSRLEAMGRVPMGSTRSAIDGLIDKADIAEAWDLYRALAAVRDIGGGGGGRGPRVNDGRGDGRKDSPTDWGGNATGGFLPAGDKGFVGERGIEDIYAMPGGGVVVTPRSGSDAAPAVAASGQPLVIQVVVPDGRVLAELAAPGVAVWMQDRQLLPGR